MKKIILIIILAHIISAGLYASPFYVNKGGGSGDGTAVSVAAVIAAGPSLGLVVALEWQGITTTAASVAFNSVAMTAGPVTTEITAPCGTGSTPRNGVTPVQRTMFASPVTEARTGQGSDTRASPSTARNNLVLVFMGEMGSIGIRGSFWFLVR